MTQEEQETLTRVGPGTPMGRLLRHYWFPIAASSEVPPGTSRAVRLLGEDLVVFRTLAGDLGLLEERCPHRGTSLARGSVDEAGIRCPYHGWQFATSGRCIDLPSEPPGSCARDRAATTSYRVQELGGLVFAHLGAEPAPLLPRYDLYVWDDVARDVGRALLPCNWLQIMENSVDPAHVQWLHGHHLAAVRRKKGLPEPRVYRRRQVRMGFDVFEHGIVKRRVVEGGSEADDDWRVGHPLVFPVTLRVGTGGQHRFQIRVPIDDTHTLHWWYSCYRPPAGTPLPPTADIPVYEVPWQGANGEPLDDTIDGGDIMTWVSQGAIADRTRETLVSSDQGVSLLRRLFFDQLARVERGLDPIGVMRDPARNRVIDLPQEREKYGDGAAYLREAVEMSHVRYSPLKDWILRHMAAPAPRVPTP
jgi:5,5'-dehydrodivanillate O-demethylase oxygenase subunit